MYTTESLSAINQRFIRSHYRITQGDVDHINNLVRLIEESRQGFPMPGDMVRLTNRWSEYYPHAHIETANGKSLHICESPYIPFVHSDDGTLYYSANDKF